MLRLEQNATIEWSRSSAGYSGFLIRLRPFQRVMACSRGAGQSIQSRPGSRIATELGSKMVAGRSIFVRGDGVPQQGYDLEPRNAQRLIVIALHVANRVHRLTISPAPQQGRGRGAITGLGCWHGCCGAYQAKIRASYWLRGRVMRMIGRRRWGADVCLCRAFYSRLGQ
jgi:hypothetical protein